MSSAAPSKRAREPHTLPPNRGVLAWAVPLLNSTIGQKVLVALTGIALTGFLIGHLVGNLKLFAGPDSINGYAKFLKDLGPLLWVARGGLLVCLVVHVVLVIRLKQKSAAARPVRYVHEKTIQASAASRYMLLSGLVVFAFAVYHIAHYTLGLTHTANGVNYLELKDEKGRHDVYSMVIAGFTNPAIAGFYIVAQILLFFHLMHGVSSVFQTLSLNTARFQRAIKKFGYAVAGLISLGNIGIVVAVLAGVR